VVVNAFRSGKVVVQGARAGELVQRHLEGAAPPAPTLQAVTAGSDEAGKGDYFGPLVVAAVVARPSDAARLVQARIRDSKTLSDGAALRAALIVRELPHAVESIGPEEYNRRHDDAKNVTKLLVDLHVRALTAVIAAAGGVERVVADEFPGAGAIRDELAKRSIRVPITITPRAEEDLAVAAASVLARAEFLIGLRELSAEWGTELPKGAGDPVDAVARDLAGAGGREALRRVAKLHFRTTEKALGGGRQP
jgi:ribonuclease HIII